MTPDIIEARKLPMLALRGLVVLPGVTIHFDVGRKASIASLETAMKEDQEVFLVAQRDIDVENPSTADLYDVGTIARIRQVMKLPGETLRVLVDGLQRANLAELLPQKNGNAALVIPFDEPEEDATTIENEALLRSMRQTFELYSSFVPKMSPEFMITIHAVETPGRLADYLAGNLMLHLPEKQAVLETFDPTLRAHQLLKSLQHEVDVLVLEQEINDQVKEQMDKNQRDYYMREQMKVLQNELGEGEGLTGDAGEYAAKIRELNLPEEISAPLLKEAAKLEKMPFGSAEATVLRSYLETCIELPWTTETKDQLDLARVRKTLDADHFGLEKVKARILEMLAVEKLTNGTMGQIICLVGPPGVGKTSIGTSIAKALDKKFARVSLGGIRDEAEIRGHRKTYIGAMPGRIINAIKIAGTKNPLILLDEIDKLSNDFHGDPSAALLEALDSEQNKTFRDHFVELPFDLSGVLFITTANTTSTIPPALFDRMEVIELSSYTDEEKLSIAKRHLVPKQIMRNGLEKQDVHITDGALRNIIDGYTRESGVRNFEREIANVLRKVAAAKAGENFAPVRITDKTLTKYLGPRKFTKDTLTSDDPIGVVNGLAWTSVGGETLQVEVAAMEGTGKLELTGSLGDVMKESAHAAITYIRSHASTLGVDSDFYKNRDIHVHVPEGAVPKDGPSAGVTITTAIVSELSGRPVRRDVAMTGEVTLRGRVLPIGGLKEKTMAAYRKGIKTVVIPAANEPDLAEIDPTVRKGLQFVVASDVQTVLNTALIGHPMPRTSKQSRSGDRALTATAVSSSVTQ